MERKSLARQILESISYEYRVPKSLQEVIYDFYLWNLIASYMKGFRPDTDSEEDLKAIALEAEEKIVEFLYDRVTYATLAGIVQEFGHGVDSLEDQKVKKVPYTTMTLPQLIAFRNIPVDDNPTSYKKALTNLLNLISRHFGNWRTFYQVASDFFKDPRKLIEWGDQYGGPSWFRIIKTFDKSRDYPASLAIDVLISLQHNTGSSLNKIDYFRELQSKWLDKKFKGSPSSFSSDSSIPSSILARYEKITGLPLYHQVYKAETSEIVQIEDKYNLVKLSDSTKPDGGIISKFRSSHFSKYYGANAAKDYLKVEISGDGKIGTWQWYSHEDREVIADGSGRKHLEDFLSEYFYA